jgi:hypothetical protein
MRSSLRIMISTARGAARRSRRPSARYRRPRSPCAPPAPWTRAVDSFRGVISRTYRDADIQTRTGCCRGQHGSAAPIYTTPPGSHPRRAPAWGPRPPCPGAVSTLSGSCRERAGQQACEAGAGPQSCMAWEPLPPPPLNLSQQAPSKQQEHARRAKII